MIITKENPEYYIASGALQFVENALENPDRIAISLESGTVIMVYIRGAIDYAADGNYRRWRLSGYNTRLTDPAAQFIYARLNRTDQQAMVVFSAHNYLLNGKEIVQRTAEEIAAWNDAHPKSVAENGEKTFFQDAELDEEQLHDKYYKESGEESETYYWVKIGSVTANTSVREISYDSGLLGTFEQIYKDLDGSWFELVDKDDRVVNDLKKAVAVRPKNNLAFYTFSYLSAFGKQNGGNGGGSAGSLLVNWEEYDPETAFSTGLSALLGKDLLDRMSKITLSWRNIPDKPFESINAEQFSVTNGVLSLKNTISGKYWANLELQAEPKTDTQPTFKSVKIGEATLSWDEANKALMIDKGAYSLSFLSGFGMSNSGTGGGGSTPIIDSLTSDSTEAALSANMGRVLKELIDSKTFTLTSSAITTALGYTPVSPTALDSLYIGTTRVQKSSANQALTGITAIDSLVNFDLANSRVGIGTASPSTKLHVNGEFSIDSSLTTDWSRAYTAIFKDLAVNSHAIGVWVGKERSTYNGGSFSFCYKGSGSTDNYMSIGLFSKDDPFVITAKGNIGINTIAPTEKLHINGSVRIGDAVLSWDSTNKALKVSTGFYSESFVSGFGASASGGNSGASSIKYGAQTFTANDDGQIDISDIAINSIKDVTIWGQPFNGTQNVTGNIYMPNNSAVFMKSNTGAYNNVLWLSGSNALHLGFEAAQKGYATQISGAVVVLHYGTSRTEGLRLTSDGKVGIGTSSPSTKLHIDSGSVGDALKITTSANYACVNYIPNNATSWSSGSNSSGSFYFWNSKIGGHVVDILDSGNVGIGTTSPSSKLHIVSDDYEILTIQRNKATGYGAAIRFENNGGFLGSFGFSGGTHYAWTDSSNTAIMALTSGGNLGIGTTAPTTKLEAYGDIKSTATGTTQRNIYVANSTGSAGIRVGTTGNRGLVDVTKNVWIIYTDGTDTLLPNNNVGIGTTIPTEKLHVNGNAKATKFIGALEGNADTATAVLDYGKTSATIKIGYNGDSLTECTYLAAYGVTSGSQVVIKDIAPSNVYGVGSAIKLKTPRSLWGNSFDGTADISASITLANNNALQSYDATGVVRTLLSLNPSNHVNIAYGCATAGYDTYVNGKSIYFVRGTGHATAMYIGSNGYVGIGTTDPSANFEVNGSVKIGGATLTWDSTNGCLKIDKGFASSSFISAFGANTNSDVQFSRIGVNVAPSSSYYAYINGTTRIDGAAYIYGATTIGSTSTTRVLTINGTISQATSTASPTTSSTSAAVSLAGGMYIAKNLRVAGSVYYGSTPSTLSDMRYKDVIEHRQIDLDKMADAPLFAFRYKDGGLEKIGTSAQYWKGIMGEFVEGDERLTLDYSALGVALGISLAKHVESHEQRIARLEKENKELKEQLKKYAA